MASGLTEKAYTASSLTLGTTYEFTVEALNDKGVSEPSTSMLILHALIPTKPSAPTTTNLGQNIIIDWTAAIDNGSPVTSYLIEIK